MSKLKLYLSSTFTLTTAPKEKKFVKLDENGRPVYEIIDTEYLGETEIKSAKPKTKDKER